MVIVVIQYRHRYLFKVIDAAIAILESYKGMVVAEQLLQFLRCGAGAHAGIPAVLCIAAFPRVVDHYLHGFGIVCHFSHLLLGIKIATIGCPYDGCSDYCLVAHCINQALYASTGIKIRVPIRRVGKPGVFTSS